jgi:ubiquinone/menaquinone biosynthesis C-methylase UbiE
MEKATDWKQFWEARSESATSDFEFDHGSSPGTEIAALSKHELLNFIDPKSDETVLDAGCGTGGNILLLHSRVKRIVGVDYSGGALERCRRRIQSNNIQNAEVSEGSITQVSLPDSSVDKVLCMSVLQYVGDNEVRLAFKEFARILKDRGVLVLHVKNISSLYLATLWMAKRAKLLLGLKTKVEHYRSYRWYVRELESLGFAMLAYNSFQLFTVEGMPSWIVRFLQKLELKYRNKFPFRLGFLQRHGAELKIKVQLVR